MAMRWVSAGERNGSAESPGDDDAASATSLSSLSSIASHPLMCTSSANPSPGIRNPFSLLDTASSSRTLSSSGAAAPPGLVASPDEASVPSADAQAPLNPAAAVEPSCDRINHARQTDAAARRHVRGSWIAGHLAQLDQLQVELEAQSPPRSPCRALRSITTPATQQRRAALVKQPSESQLSSRRDQPCVGPLRTAARRVQPEQAVESSSSRNKAAPLTSPSKVPSRCCLLQEDVCLKFNLAWTPSVCSNIKQQRLRWKHAVLCRGVARCSRSTRRSALRGSTTLCNEQRDGSRS